MELDAKVARRLARCSVEDMAGYAVFSFGHFGGLSIEELGGLEDFGRLKGVYGFGRELED